MNTNIKAFSILLTAAAILLSASCFSPRSEKTVSAAEIAAYSLIGIHSVFSPLARINLAAFVSSDELFRVYRSFNFFVDKEYRGI